MLQVLENIELRRKTTLRLGGIVPFFYDIRTEDDLMELPKLSEKIGMEIRILGGGSNLLITDESLGHANDILNFSVAQIQMSYENEEKFREVFLWQDDALAPPLAKQALLANEHGKALRAKVGAGMPIQRLLKLCADQGCTGLEGLMGIPGKIGGAVAMNAGAYLDEMDNVLESVGVYTKELGFLTLNRDEFVNTYRCFTPYYNNSPIKDYVICNASFIFPFTEREKIKEKMHTNLIAKKGTQPIKAYTAGCVFKNPIDENGVSISAGKLLDEAGFKGKELNGMRFSPIHANFLENMGHGDAHSALELIKEAEDKVLADTSIQLQREVKLWL